MSIASQLKQLFQAFFFSILSTTFRQFWCYQDTYLVDEEEDLSDVEIVVRPECEPSMV